MSTIHSTSHRTCTEPGCNKPHVGRGYCNTHYRRRQRAGEFTPRTLADRFWAKVNKAGPNDCWEWHGCHSLGYGYLKVRGKMRRATHIVWYMTYGHWPHKDLQVCHICDNPACVNPLHLFLGPPAVNMRDMVNKGRNRSTPKYGVENGQSKLTPEKVREIRRRYDQGATQPQLAESFGLHRETVGKIVRRERWAHVR